MTRMLPGDYARDAELYGVAMDGEMPGKTWNLNGTGGDKRYLDGIEALKQSIGLALETPRYAHLIYSFDYGSELITLFGQSNELVRTEGQRLIKEALLTDDRIYSVDNFRFDFSSDSVEISFDVKSKYGSFTGEFSL